MGTTMPGIPGSLQSKVERLKNRQSRQFSMVCHLLPSVISLILFPPHPPSLYACLICTLVLGDLDEGGSRDIHAQTPAARGPCNAPADTTAAACSTTIPSQSTPLPHLATPTTQPPLPQGAARIFCVALACMILVNSIGTYCSYGMA